MIRLNYTVLINCPIVKVYDFMLGYTDISSYEEWTSLFSPTSSYEGNWEVGSKMLFTSLDKEGKKAGMVSKILQHRPNELVSIQHYGMLKNGEEITSGPEVDEWAGSHENYLFQEKDGQTMLTIEIDTIQGHEEYMNKLYPNALSKLKEICER